VEKKNKSLRENPVKSQRRGFTKNPICIWTRSIERGGGPEGDVSDKRERYRRGRKTGLSENNGQFYVETLQSGGERGRKWLELSGGWILFWGEKGTHKLGNTTQLPDRISWELADEKNKRTAGHSRKKSHFA